MKKAERDKRNWERVQYALDKVTDVVKTVLGNPIFSAMAAYGTVHFVGNLKRSDGKYYMHEAVVRALKGVAAAYPVYYATRGGTAGVIAASGIAAAVGIAADRPDDVRLPDYNYDYSQVGNVSPDVVEAIYKTTLPLYP